MFGRAQRFVRVYKFDCSRDHGNKGGTRGRFFLLKCCFYVGAFKARFHGQL